MLIDTTAKFEKIEPSLLACMDPAVDTETNGTNSFGTVHTERNEIIGISTDDSRDAYYFPFRHLQGRNLPLELIPKFFASYLSNPNRTYGGFNYKFDEHMGFADGMPYAQNYEDAMLGLHLLNENEPNFRLKDICDRYGIGDGSLQESLLKEKVLGECKRREIRVSEAKSDPDNWKSKMNVLTPADVEPYACDDVRLTRELLEFEREALVSCGLYDIFKQVNYYSYITTMMENRGMMLDTGLMEQYAEEATTHAKKAMDALYKAAGYEINPNSPKQICAFLGVKSSAAEVLDAIIAMNGPTAEFAKLVRDARGWTSVQSRYYTPYANGIDRNGVLHCSLNLMGTISGRLSCSNPNLQAVARQTEVFKVKDVFIARPGYTLISADYSQAEMRLSSMYAKEETMAEFIRQGADIHSVTANNLGIPRDAAKRINFGVIYGIGAEALHNQIHVEKGVAQGFLDQYHGMYPGFKRLSRACERDAERDGVIRLWTGRMRHFNVPTAYSHKAMSNLIQGGVAEIMRVSISRLFPAICDMFGFLNMQIHDQIIAEIPDENVHIALPTIKAIMEDFPFDPAMTVDVKYGKRWGSMVGWKLGEKVKVPKK